MATPKKPQKQVLSEPVVIRLDDLLIPDQNMVQFNPDLVQGKAPDEEKWIVSIDIHVFANDAKNSVAKAVWFLQDPEVARFHTRIAEDDPDGQYVYSVDYEMKKARAEHNRNMAKGIAKIMDDADANMALLHAHNKKVEAYEAGEREKVIEDLLTKADKEAASKPKPKVKQRPKKIKVKVNLNKTKALNKTNNQMVYDHLKEGEYYEIHTLTDQQLADLDEYTQGGDEQIYREIHERELNQALGDTA